MGVPMSVEYQVIDEIIERPTIDDTDEQHVICCVDDNTALCGTDVSKATWSMRDTTCVVCADLDHEDAIFCPIKRRLLCPLD